MAQYLCIIRVGTGYEDYRVVVFWTNANVDHVSRLAGFSFTAFCASLSGSLSSLGPNDSATARRLSCLTYSAGVPSIFPPTEANRARAWTLRSFCRDSDAAWIFSSFEVGCAKIPPWASENAPEMLP